MQGLADSAGACQLGLEVSLDLVGQHSLGQIGAEDGSVGQDVVQLVGGRFPGLPTSIPASLACRSSLPGKAQYVKVRMPFRNDMRY